MSAVQYQDDGSTGHLPRMQLDDLLEELQVRIDAVRGTRDRIHSLLEAVLSVGRELELSQVLQRIAEAAVLLVDAEYGALGVIAEDGTLAQFIPVGVTDQQAQAIGPLPTGHGLLGELIRNPMPLRLPDLAQHPSSQGFPPHHPPMRSFLGVPIRVRDEVFGNLYLAEKRDSKEFDSEDETVLSTLAAAAGVAIENARLYEEANYRQRWMEANAEVTRALLSGVGERRVLGLIVELARNILSADLGVLALPEENGAALRVAVASGTDAEAHRGLLLPREGSFAGAAVDAGEVTTSVDVEHDPRITAGPPRWAGLGPAVAVPMIAEDASRGVLLLARSKPRQPFADTQTAPLSAFAGQAAVAMELAERRRDAEQIALFEDRDRIARDLHDLAIQRLFATGMTLQSAMRFVDHPKAGERLMRAVDDLDATIKIIRSTIFGLRAHDTEPGGEGLRSRLTDAVQDVAPALGFTPALRMEGLLETEVPSEIADQAVAVLREALSNAARHSGAGAVQVAAEATGDAFRLSVEDDGVGVPAGARRSGLHNLAERAEGLGGELHMETPEAGGTRLLWRVPLHRSTG
ncbi:GAF domain-containing sensor histidine kinase [Streptomyces ovatisporus]|uniref:GAF domain-containing sensor histidine kinase n=1 Tax=Streptomyces ovatisporus TaxID=1128682 RepID=A0ABV9A715_9ACTN